MTEHPHQLPQPVELPVDERESSLPLPAQLGRFIITGGFSAIVDFGLLVILMALGLGHTPAKAISFIAGTTTAYLINRRWTFRASPSTRRFVAVVILYALVGATTILVLRAMGRRLRRAGGFTDQDTPYGPSVLAEEVSAGAGETVR